MIYVPLQVKYGEGNPWRVLITCILLNRTRRTQVVPVLERFFSEYPDPYSLRGYVFAPHALEELARILRPLGLQANRAYTIAFFSAQWIARPEWRNRANVQKFMGCGQYAEDAWRIFVDHDYSVPAKDTVLEAWRRTQIARQQELLGLVQDMESLQRRSIP